MSDTCIYTHTYIYICIYIYIYIYIRFRGLGFHGFRVSGIRLFRDEGLAKPIGFRVHVQGSADNLARKHWPQHIQKAASKTCSWMARV